MPYNPISEFFDKYLFFNQLLRNPGGPLPDWETARKHITDFFLDLQSNLLERMHENDIVTLWVEPVPPKQMAGELYKDFQLREHILFFLFFRAVCYQIQESIMSSLEYGKLNESVEMLLYEVDRLDAHLSLIGCILDPPVREEAISPVEMDNETTLQEQENIKWTTDEDEMDGQEEIESSSVEDIDSYMEEIRSVTIAGITGESMAPGQITTFHTSSFPYIDSPIWDKQNYFNFVQPFDYADEILTDFSVSSTIIDPNDFLNVNAYKKLLNVTEGEGEEEEGILNDRRYSVV
ncbi:hypothetical protein PRIPAC_88112 [Pristionchus pacificus]|uniref:Uncharacterized protein n=1 Tax=Pristionchus pacificus TaxID=54126 RepID=A0A2A6CVR1_PRIPA|nr:hypothetical protein PRIPAC_88112 [Pristionchus pacificus]|eukprot:PDM82218.1 hypothetical protein PRIPAC_36611 [Pristionchus pacificus]